MEIAKTVRSVRSVVMLVAVVGEVVVAVSSLGLEKWSFVIIVVIVEVKHACFAMLIQPV